MKCQQNLRKFNKITVENVNEKLKKGFYNVYKKCKECLYNILGELQGNCARCLFVCLFVFFFNKMTMEGKQEERKSQKMCAKVNKMFVNVPKQSTRLKNLSILF